MIDRSVGSLTLKKENHYLTLFSSIIQNIKESKFNPVLIKNTYGDNYLSFHALDINQFGNENKIYLDSISEVLDKYYIRNDTLDRISKNPVHKKKVYSNKIR